MILLGLAAWLTVSVALGLNLGPWVRRRAHVRYRVECAWCGLLLEDGTGPVSHGICDGCVEKLLPLKSEGPVAHLSASTTGPTNPKG